MEGVITVVLLGLLATIAIPSYQNVMTQTRIKDATTTLQLLYTAQKIYFNEHGVYVEGANVDELNTNLNLGIIPNKVAYNCDPKVCYATGTGVSLSIDITAPTPVVN